MDSSDTIHKKINSLQAQLLDFHEKISPLKKSPFKREIDSLPRYNEPDPKITFFDGVCGFLKLIFTLLLSLVFPTAVYCIEGYCALLWQAFALSVGIFLVLVLRTLFIDPCYFPMEVDKIKNIISSNLSKEIFIYAISVTIIVFVGTWSYQNEKRLFFYASLAAGAFVGGILWTKLYARIANDNKLPHLDPVRHKSPRRSLNFSDENNKKHDHKSPYKSFKNKTPSKTLQEPTFSYNRDPVTPPPSYQETLATPLYLLPQNLNTFHA